MAANLPQVKAKVQEILAGNFNGVQLGSVGDFSIRNGSTRVFIKPWEQESRTLVSVSAPLLRAVPESPELFKHVAMHTDDYVFGHLALITQDDGLMMILTHTLLGDYLDEEELTQAVIAVAEVGDDIDDELRQQFGGHVFHED